MPRSQADLLSELNEHSLLDLLDGNYSQFRYLKLELVLTKLIDFCETIEIKPEQEKFKKCLKDIRFELRKINQVEASAQKEIIYRKVITDFKACITEYI